MVKVEALDELAKIVFSGNKKRAGIVKRIKSITEQGMSGEINFRESLSKRILLLAPKRHHVKKLVKVIERSISKSFLQNISFIRKKVENIYIISGGFREWILPVVKIFGISADHVIANVLLYDEKGKITGFDRTNIMANELGKVNALRNLKLNGKITMIGDGFSDYQTKLYGEVDEFYLFTGNVLRHDLVDKADHVIEDFGQFIKINEG